MGVDRQPARMYRHLERGVLKVATCTRLGVVYQRPHAFKQLRSDTRSLKPAHTPPLVLRWLQPANFRHPIHLCAWQTNTMRRQGEPTTAQPAATLCHQGCHTCDGTSQAQLPQARYTTTPASFHTPEAPKPGCNTCMPNCCGQNWVQRIR